MYLNEDVRVEERRRLGEHWPSNVSEQGAGVRPGFVQGSFVGYNSFRTKSVLLRSASAVDPLQIGGKKRSRGCGLVWSKTASNHHTSQSELDALNKPILVILCLISHHKHVAVAVIAVIVLVVLLVCSSSRSSSISISSGSSSSCSSSETVVYLGELKPLLYAEDSLSWRARPHY